jgi:hypothetical protein
MNSGKREGRQREERGKREGKQREERGKREWEKTFQELFPTLSFPLPFPLSSLLFPEILMTPAQPLDLKTDSGSFIIAIEKRHAP